MENKNSPALLNPNGKIEITEFFDYDCGHCKEEYKVVEELINKKKDIRVMLRAVPILGENSMLATQIGHGIMISEPDKYLKYVQSFMKNFNYEGDSIRQALEDSGVNIKKLKETLNSKQKEIGNMIKKDSEMAEQYGIQGTPAFIINDKVVPGAVDFDTLVSYL